MKRKFHTFGYRVALVLFTLAFALPLKWVCAEGVPCVDKASCPMSVAFHVDHNVDPTKGPCLSLWNCCKDLKSGLDVIAAIQSNPIPSCQLFKSFGLSHSPGVDTAISPNGIRSPQKILVQSAGIHSADYSFISLTLSQSSFLC